MFLSTRLLAAIVSVSAFCVEVSAALLPDRDVSSFVYGRQETTNPTSGSWPYGPFSTQGRDIVNTKGEAVTFAGVNWPSSGETMVPEGLEWASIEDILSRVQSVGFNFIRLTYAIEMIDQIYERNGSDVGLEITMINGLGYENGTKVTNEIIAKNPTFNKDTTRFEIWDHIAQVALSKNIYIHPDVHVGKAQWCCNNTDGNAWFDDYNFPVANWKRGLQYVAKWASKHNNVVSMSLRNELRRAINETAPTSSLGYNWVTLVGNYTAATDAIHSANPDLLVTWSGMQYDQDLSALIQGKNLNTAPCYKCDAIRDGLRRDPIIFDLALHPWSNKVVYELHLYSMSEDLDTGSCPIVFAELYNAGFNALGMAPPPACNITKNCSPAVRNTPVILSEFGAAQDVTLLNDTLMNCLKDFTLQNNVSWAMWSLAGSYRIRSGAQGVGDTWALGNYDWNGWNYPEGVEKWWKPWISSMFG